MPATVAAADAAATGSAGLFVPATGRLLDTRSGTGGYSTPMPANTVRTVPAAGMAGIPSSGVSAVALTLTAVGAPSAGAISVAPGDVATPTGTALVFNPSDSVSNTDLVALHADGALHVVSNAAVNLIIDVQGYFTGGGGTAPGGFVAVDQSRIVDTRNGTNVAQAQVASGGAISVTAAGLAGVPSDASAVYVNIAVLGQTVNGYLRTYATGAAVPTTGALGFDNTTQSESVAVPLSDTGAFTVLVGAGGPVDLIIDIQGYFTAGETSGSFTSAAVHLLDTRAAPVRTIAGNGVLTLPVAGIGGLPAVGASLSALALNLRTVQPSSTPNASGFLRVWPGDQPEPATSSLNYTRLDVYRTDLAIVSPAVNGTINIRNGGPNPIDVVIDAEGWFADPGPAMPLVDSAGYPEGGWGPPGSGQLTFTVSDGAGSAAQSYQYALDGAAPSTLPGTATQFSLPIPAALGQHTLTVAAVDRYGVASDVNDYDFNIGTAPAAPTAPSVLSGNASVDLSWTSGAENGAPTLGFGFGLSDLTTGAAPQNLGSCAGCSHFVITGLDPTHSYTAQLWAISAAGNSPASTSALFTADGADPLQCADGDESCGQQDSSQPAPTNLPYENYDLAGGTADTSGTVSADTTSTDPAQTTSVVPAGTSTGPAPPTTDPQCGQSTDQRTGNWVCPIVDSSSTTASGSTDPGSAQLDNTAPSSGGGGGGYCNYNGSCFTEGNTFTASWVGTVAYGNRISGFIGYATADITWQLIGAQSWSSTVKWKATSETRDVIFSAAMYNGAPGVPHGGTMLGRTWSWSPSTAVVEPETTVSWRPHGYKAYDNKNWDHNVLTEFSWSVPGVPGYFWMNVRSPCSHTTRLGTGASYRFGSSLKFPGDLERAGWSW